MIHDERLYGIAPTERDAHGGTVYLTMFGVMKVLGISEATMRRNPGLMALRKVLGPNTFRWIEEDVREWLRAQSAGPKQSRRQKRQRVFGVGTDSTALDRKKRTGAQRDSALKAIMDAKMALYFAGKVDDAAL